MRRSEVIQDIATQLILIVVAADGKIMDYTNAQRLADKILTNLEKEHGFCPVKIDSYGFLELLDYDKENEND